MDSKLSAKAPLFVILSWFAPLFLNHLMHRFDDMKWALVETAIHHNDPFFDAIRHNAIRLEAASFTALVCTPLFALLYPLIAYWRRERIWWLAIPPFVFGILVLGLFYKIETSGNESMGYDFLFSSDRGPVVLDEKAWRVPESPNIPASSWEQQKEGVSLALVLVKWTESRPHGYAINVYLKNTSSVRKYFQAGYGPDGGFWTYYDFAPGTNMKGNLHEAVNMPHGGDIGARITPPILMEPGQILGQTINLTPRDLALVQRYSIMCDCYISDHENFNESQHIESSPKLLIASP